MHGGQSALRGAVFDRRSKLAKVYKERSDALVAQLGGKGLTPSKLKLIDQLVRLSLAEDLAFRAVLDSAKESNGAAFVGAHDALVTAGRESRALVTMLGLEEVGSSVSRAQTADRLARMSTEEIDALLALLGKLDQVADSPMLAGPVLIEATPTAATMSEASETASVAPDASQQAGDVVKVGGGVPEACEPAPMPVADIAPETADLLRGIFSKGDDAEVH